MFIFGGGTPNGTLKESISTLNLSSGLQLCLDAGDLASYDGSSQTWNDRSGGGYNFYRGATSSATTDDPTFNGTAGALSAYFSVNGSQYFQLTAANPSWVNALHQASAQYTMFFLIYPPASGVMPLLGTDGGSSGATGMYWDPLDVASPYVSRSTPGSGAFQVFPDNAPSRSAWHAVAVSINVGGGNVSFIWRDGAYVTVSASNTFTATYSSPSAGGASNTIGLLDYGSSSGSAANGTRLMCAAIWNTALSKANLDALFTAQRTRVGI